ncbi:MAG: hypothetical protein HMLIMOIP_002580 [Candidatus Nitrosomirales archaeon]|jgi:hypothetical protein
MTDKPKHLQPTFIMVPRKLIIAWITTFLVTMIGVTLSAQWANYVDRRSNQRWCGIITILDDANKSNPPKTEIQKKLATKFHEKRKEFRCE